MTSFISDDHTNGFGEWAINFRNNVSQNLKKFDQTLRRIGSQDHRFWSNFDHKYSFG